MENNFKQWNLDQKRLEFKEQKRQIIAKAEQEKYALNLKYQDDWRDDEARRKARKLLKKIKRHEDNRKDKP